MPNVHVFVVNYNSSSLLRDCLKSLMDEPVAWVHVTDNYSSDKERENVLVLEREFPRVSVELSELNVGFGAALNSAIGKASLNPEDVIWILNPDTVVLPDAVPRMLEHLRSGYDIVSPVILTGNRDSPRVWFSGGILDRRRVRTLHVGLGSPWNIVPGSAVAAPENTFITGAAMMMTFGQWVKLGGFREAYFLYWEDADLSERATSMGLRLGVASSATIWHQVGGSGSTTGMSSAYYYYMQRNRLWFGRQWQSRMSILLGPGLHETLLLTVRPLKEMEGRLPKMLSSIRGLLSGLTQKPL